MTIPFGMTVWEARRHLKWESKRYGATLEEIPRQHWEHAAQQFQTRTLRSRRFLVQVFQRHGQVRLTVTQTGLNDDGSWKDGITWDELQTVKRECGYGAACAVELFPPDEQVVNVANLRHLWIVPAPDFMWQKAPAKDG
jgi:hypothetical protein